ncbi:bifunctional NUDIX hydrolase/phosphatase PAP2 family protein, partial [Vibrio genomosp. F10]
QESIIQKSVTQEMPDSIRGALCMVKANEKVVLVNEILTQQISLPGGTIDPGEPPSLTAQRETWEETGLVVTVGDVLGYTNTAVIYDCISDSEIIAYEYNNELDGNTMPIWFAPHYGIEVSSAMLLLPELLPNERYRYPEQWNDIKAMHQHATDQSVTFVSELIKAAPELNQSQLHWIVSMQQSVASLPSVILAAIELGNGLLNQLTKPWLLLIILPILYWRFGKEFNYKVFFAITATSLLCLVAQQGFAIPRPHAYIPAIDMYHSYGFGFPSLPIAIWFCIAGLVYKQIDDELKQRFVIGFLSLVLLVGLSQFYSGSAFIWDMLIGALLGILVAWHIIRLESKPDVDLMSVICSRGLWVAVSVGAVALTVIWPLPVFTSWIAITITMLGLVLSLERDKKTILFKQLLIIIAFLLSANQLLLFIASFVSYSSILSLMMESIRFPILIICYAGLVRKFSQ